jgi:ArsR family transcriptional regulator, arsenate/arsenite/antimonite-responsive transcriptional repressor
MQLATAPSTVAQAFHALSDQTRIAILKLLSRGERCVCDLQDPLELSQPLLSFHLRVLRKAGLVQARREGRWAFYALNPAGVEVLKAYLARLQEAAERVLPIQQDDCC